jgi:ribose 5-phosphate isomerase
MRTSVFQIFDAEDILGFSKTLPAAVLTAARHGIRPDEHEARFERDAIGCMQFVRGPMDRIGQSLIADDTAAILDVARQVFEYPNHSDETIGVSECVFENGILIEIDGEPVGKQRHKKANLLATQLAYLAAHPGNPPVGIYKEVFVS